MLTFYAYGMKFIGLGHVDFTMYWSRWSKPVGLYDIFCLQVDLVGLYDKEEQQVNSKTKSEVPSLKCKVPKHVLQGKGKCKGLVEYAIELLST